MRIHFFLFACGATLLISTTSTFADRADCEDAISSYNSAVSDISTALRRYSNCISASQGRDDCSGEFRRLRNAQGDFESAVSRYGSECN
jgi:hypothetical protein